MHLARDGAKTPFKNIQASTRAEVRASIIFDFETSQVFFSHVLFQICLSLSESAKLSMVIDVKFSLIVEKNYNH